MAVILQCDLLHVRRGFKSLSSLDGNIHGSGKLRRLNTMIEEVLYSCHNDHPRQ